MVVRYGNGQVKEKMSDIEKKWMDQLVKHKDLLFFVIISILGMVMRQQGRDFISADMRDFRFRGMTASRRRAVCAH